MTVTEQRGPLAGVRVIDLTTAWAGPFGSRVLAYLGAEVIHVEAASRLDLWRGGGHGLDPVRFPDLEPGERPYNRTVLFNSQNLNKLSLTVDVKLPGGRELLLKLAAVSDVVLSNFTPGTLDRMGIGYDALKQARPDIIVLEMPAFGNSGPMAHYGALGPGMEFSSGMSAFIGYDTGEPLSTGPAYLDPIGGYNAAAAVMTALVYRQKSGEGQYIEMSQVEAAMPFIGELTLDCLETGMPAQKRGNHVPGMAPHDAFPARGKDSWVVIAVGDDAQWRAFSNIIGAPELATDPRFATADARWNNQAALHAPIANWTQQRDRHEIAQQLQSAGIAAAPVQNGEDLAYDPYLHARGFFTQLDHPDVGQRTYQGLPFKLSLTPGGQTGAAPCLGEHTLKILRDIIGLSETEIAALDAAGTIANVPPGGPQARLVQHWNTPTGKSA